MPKKKSKKKRGKKRSRPSSSRTPGDFMPRQGKPDGGPGDKRNLPNPFA